MEPGQNDSTKLARRAQAWNNRTVLFAYNTALLIGLIIAGTWFLSAGRNGLLHDENIRDGLGAVWFAVLGGVAISFKGIFDHRTEAEWRGGWVLWYLGRPFSCFIVGVMTLALLKVVNPNSPPSVPAVAIAAFTLGTQERRFFAFLYQVAKLVLNTPDDSQDGLQIHSLNPETGPGGSVLIVEGQGFQAGALVTVGAAPLTSAVVSSDGTSIAGVVPTGTAGSSADVLVTNPDNAARRSPAPFKYA